MYTIDLKKGPTPLQQNRSTLQGIIPAVGNSGVLELFVPPDQLTAVREEASGLPQLIMGFTIMP